MRKYDKRRKIKEESDSEQTETSSNSSSKETSKLPTYNETSDETKLWNIPYYTCSDWYLIFSNQKTIWIFIGCTAF